jgi:ADP-ribose pyrophosphatase
LKKETYRIISSKKIYDGHIIKLVKDRFILRAAPDKVVTRELVIHPGAVAIIPYAEKNKIVLLRQFRYAAQGDLWEIPAGTLEKGEATITCAKRELEEETGFRAKRWIKLGQFFLAPGISDEKMTLYRADHLYPGVKKLDHDEWIRHELVSVVRAKKMIRDGKIRDAKTIAGILWPQV